MALNEQINTLFAGDEKKNKDEDTINEDKNEDKDSDISLGSIGEEFNSLNFCLISSSFLIFSYLEFKNSTAVSNSFCSSSDKFLVELNLDLTSLYPD